MYRLSQLRDWEHWWNRGAYTTSFRKLDSSKET